MSQRKSACLGTLDPKKYEEDEETIEGALILHKGGCQNHGPFLGTVNIRCHVIIGTPKGTIILSTTQGLHVDCFDDWNAKPY